MDLEFIQSKVKSLEYDLSSHAHQERQVEQITVEEIKKILLSGDIIETYPEDPRGESCLVAGFVDDKVLHAVCGTRGNRLLIVTVYKPKPLSG